MVKVDHFFSMLARGLFPKLLEKTLGWIFLIHIDTISIQFFFFYFSELGKAHGIGGKCGYFRLGIGQTGLWRRAENLLQQNTKGYTLHIIGATLTSNGIARMPPKLCTSKGDYWIKQWFSSIVSLFQNGNFSLRKEFAPRGSEFFPLRAVPYGMENHFYYIR